jgi:hypothetical protein
MDGERMREKEGRRRKKEVTPRRKLERDMVVRVVTMLTLSKSSSMGTSLTSYTGRWRHAQAIVLACWRRVTKRLAPCARGGEARRMMRMAGPRLGRRLGMDLWDAMMKRDLEKWGEKTRGKRFSRVGAGRWMSGGRERERWFTHRLERG